MGKNILILLMPIMLAISNTAVAQSDNKCNSKYADEIANGMAIDIKESCKIIESIRSHINSLQDNISIIAGNTISYNEKVSPNGRIVNTISLFFEDEWSNVHVSSLKNKLVKKMTVKDYLLHIANYSEKGVYEDAKVTFLQTQFNKFLKIDDNSFQIDITAWQKTELCMPDGDKCYEDATLKLFHVKVLDKNYPSPKISEIEVLSTLPLDNFLRLNGE